MKGKCYGIGLTKCLNKMATKIATVSCDRLFLGHLSDCIIITFVLVCHKLFLVR